MSTVIGIRHARVENPGNLVYARLPGYHLSDEGREATETLAAALAPKAIVAIFASPLERAQQTAGLLAAPHGLEVQTDERLIEWSFWTRWEGTPWTDVRERAPEVFSHYVDDPERLHPDDPLSSSGAGVVAWATDAAAAYPEGIVLGVSHEAPLAAAALVADARPLNEFASVQVSHLIGVRLHPTPAVVGRPQDLAHDPART